MRPDRFHRFAGLLALALLASVLVGFAPSAAPPAQAGESSASTQGNYVALSKPARVLSKTFGEATYWNSATFTALGVQGIPRAGTRALVVVVTLKSNDAGADISLSSMWEDGDRVYWYDTLAATHGVTTTVSGVETVPVDARVATNQLVLDTTKEPATVTVDVVGYYTANAVGGGFVATRPATLFDTRKAPEVIVPAGGVITRKLTGGVIPEGATAAYLNLAVGSMTAAGTVVAVPATVDPATANPVMAFWNGATTHVDMAVVKLPADGRVTFKNTSSKPVHLMVRVQGYTTSSPATGADFQPYTWISGYPSRGAYIEPGASEEVPVSGADVTGISKDAVAVPVQVSVDTPQGTTPAYGSLRIHPKGEAGGSPISALSFNASMGGSREAGGILVPGREGFLYNGRSLQRRVVVENVSSVPMWVWIQVRGAFTVSTDAVAAGGEPLVGLARTSAGPCYGYVDPASQGVSATCTDDYEQTGLQAVWTPLSRADEKFRAPVAIASRTGGRFVVAAVHAPDGEVWTWQRAHGTGALPDTPPVRTYRRVRTAVTTANLPDGRPVGFAADAEGRWWAIDLDVPAPEQPVWKPLEVPLAVVAPVGDITAVATTTGIRLAGRTAAGDVVTASYAAGTTSLGWRRLGAVDVVGKVGLGVAQSGDIRLAVRHADSTVWSARLDPVTGVTVDGWHPVGVPDPAVAPVGTPSVVYDPQTQRNGILVRSGATSTGALYRVWEATPGSGDFSGAFSGVSLESGGVGSDLTTWDYRTEEPLYRRWSFLYVDANLSRRLGTSYAS